MTRAAAQALSSDPLVTRNISMPASLERELTARAKALGIGRAELVRTACQQWLARNPAPGQPGG